MVEPVNNYPLSTEQNDSIPLDIAKPSILRIYPKHTTGVTITLSEEENNVVSISCDTLCFISTNAAINDYADLSLAGANSGVYAITPNFTHVLALPETVYLFSPDIAGTEYIYIQEIIRWAAMGGQAISYEAS